MSDNYVPRTVKGKDAEGATLGENPVPVGGKDGSGNSRAISTDANGRPNVNVVDALPAGDNNVGNVDIVSGPSGANALETQGTAADGAAAVGNPVQVGGKEVGGNMQAVLVDSDGHVQVDVLTGGGAPPSPTNPTVNNANTTDTAAGASADLDSSDVGGTVKKLVQLILTASVPFKAVLKTINDGTLQNTYQTMFVKAGETFVWDTPQQDYVQKTGAGGAGFDGFRVTVTNMDDSDAADIYVTFMHQE
jgi:hypothetical protein